MTIGYEQQGADMGAHMTRTTRTRQLAVVIALVAALILTACRDASDPSVTLPSPSVAASSSTAPPNVSPAVPVTPTGTPQQQILAAYLGMQEAFREAGETADPAYPDLTQYAAGAALRRLKTGLASMKGSGLRSRGTTDYRPKVESMEPAAAPSKARVRDCMDTTKAEAYKANGDPYTDTPGGLRLVIADLQRIDSAWKVTGLGVHEVGSCKR